MKWVAKGRWCLWGGNGQEHHRPAGPPFHSSDDWQARGLAQPRVWDHPARDALRQPGGSAGERGEGACPPHCSRAAFPRIPAPQGEQGEQCHSVRCPRWLRHSQQLSMPWHGTATLTGSGEAGADLPLPVPTTGLSPGGCGWAPAVPSAQPRHAAAAQLGSPRALPVQPSRPTGPPGSRAVAGMPPGRPGPAWVRLVTHMAGISRVRAPASLPPPHWRTLNPSPPHPGPRPGCPGHHGAAARPPPPPRSPAPPRRTVWPSPAHSWKRGAGDG